MLSLIPGRVLSRERIQRQPILLPERPLLILGHPHRGRYMVSPAYPQHSPLGLPLGFPLDLLLVISSACIASPCVTLLVSPCPRALNAHAPL